MSDDTEGGAPEDAQSYLQAHFNAVMRSMPEGLRLGARGTYMIENDLKPADMERLWHNFMHEGEQTHTLVAEVVMTYYGKPEQGEVLLGKLLTRMRHEAHDVKLRYNGKEIAAVGND
jgi:hypothetical protein